METLWQDLRYGSRMLAKSPGFTAVAVLTLALGIGANTAIFSVVDAVLLRRLPVPNPQQLVIFGDPDAHGLTNGSSTGDRGIFSYHEFEELRDRNEVFSGIFAVGSFTDALDANVDTPGAGDQTEPVKTTLASGAYFSVLGVNAILGQTFTADADKVRGANPVGVISYSFWQRRFAGDPSVIGHTIRIHRTSFQIIGVTPPGFLGETVGAAPDLWVPLSMQAAVFPGRDWLNDPKSIMERISWVQIMARLKPGVTLEQARASINVTFQQMLETDASSSLTEDQRKEWLDQKIPLVAGSKGASELHGRFAEPLLVLMAVVGLVLLIACANVANLLLARAAARQKEIAVRLALGAGSARLVRQMLTESILLALIGGAVGLFLAQWADALLVRMASTGPDLIPLDLAPDARILGFTVAVSMLTGVLFGVAPAFRATRLDLSPILKGTASNIAGGNVSNGRSRMSVGKILVIAQVALSLLLVVVAGLFVRSFQKIADVKLGYNPEKLLLFRIDPLQSGYKGATLTHFYDGLLEKIAAIPGVHAVTLSENGLFSHTESGDPLWVEGYTPKTEEDRHARFDQVGPHYFAAVGIPVLLGRDVSSEDGGNGPRAGWINETMARFYFPSTNPIGKHIKDTYPDNPAEFEVVGVVADAKYNSLKEKTPRRFYVPFFHPITETSAVNFEIRTAADPGAVSASIRQVVKETDATLPTLHIHTMYELVDESLVRDRLLTRLSSLFGALALLLACIGLYGVMAYAVARRTNEIGIRMALGAQRGDVIWMVLRETMLLVLIGVAIGVPAVLASGRLISSLLFGLTPADPIAISVATLVLVAVAALAGFIPARRASRVDPIVALRYE